MKDITARKQLLLIGQRIRQLRHERKLSQEQLAEQADIHVTYLSALEGGKRNASLGILFSIADALDVPAYELLNFKRLKKPLARANAKKRP